MKYLATLFMIFLSAKPLAGCFAELTRNDIKLDVQKVTVNSTNDMNDELIETIKISVLNIYDNAPLETILLTNKLREFWYPIAFDVQSSRALTTLNVKNERLNELEIVFLYKYKECTLSYEGAL